MLNWLSTNVKMLQYYIQQFGPRKMFKAIGVSIIRESFLSRFNDNVVKLKDYYLITNPKDNGISRDLRIFKIWEPFTAAYLRNSIKSGWNIVEIGANLGYYAILEAKLIGDNGKVIAFEPEPTNFDYLLKNIKLNNLNNILPYKYAIGETECESYLELSQFSNWHRIVNVAGKNCIKVKMVSLDNFLPTILNSINLLRMDVEGYELEVLKGAKKIISEFKPHLFIEFHYDELLERGKITELSDIIKFLDRNYVCEFLMPRRLNSPIGSWSDVKRHIDIKTLMKLYNKTLSVILAPR